MTAREFLGHYVVLGPIGSGGMGEVYVARDPKLGRKVAIKLLPQRLATDRSTLTRFTQEARSASALNHPNIVTIHEVGTHEDTPYIVMEYIEGRDLRMLLHDGPVPIRKVVELGVQIADGLAAAHERGIVHRDLKPENIMVTRDGYAKILDFGLAKVMTPADDDRDNTLQLDMPGTNPGTILGTVGYMSPEQASGKRLDFRSDQFAFGAILYELITGTAAFEGDTAIDTLSAILHHAPLPITRTNPRVPVQLSDMIRRLLAKSPEDRYSSPRDLARELRLLRDRVAAEESGFHPAPTPETRRKRAIAAIGAAALAIAVGGTLWIRRDPPPPAAATQRQQAAAAPQIAKKYLAVIGFTDLTGDPAGQLVVDGFAETLTARLAHYPDLQVMRPPASDTVVSDNSKIARDLGANLVLRGQLMRNGDRIRVTYAVLEPATKREWRDLVEGSVTNLFGVQDDVAESVARNLDLGQSVARTTLDPAVSQRHYLEAIGHLRRYDKEESLDSAIEILEDLGNSPSVQAALARAYLHKFTATREPQLAAIAGRAAESALQSDPQSIDVNITLGELRRQTGRHQEAIAAFLRVLSQQPNNTDAVLGLAETYRAAGDMKNAESSYQRAIELQPNFWGGYNKLGAFYYFQGRIEDSVPMFRKVVELVPDNQRGYSNLGGVYQRLGRHDDAIRVFLQSIRQHPSGHAYANLGTTYYFLGRYQDAANAFTKATELTPHDYQYWRFLGDAYRWVPGRENEARNAFERAIGLCKDTIRVNSSDAYAHCSLAVALAKTGKTEQARRAILRALELEPRDAVIAYEAAVIASIAGSDEDAVARIEQSLRLGYSASDIERDPQFENLRKGGRLSTIIQRSGSDQSEN